MPDVYTHEQKEIALGILKACDHDVERAAKLSAIPARVLLHWSRGGGIEDVPPDPATLVDGLPEPPEFMASEERFPERFVPEPRLMPWVVEHLIKPGPLYNEHHWYLENASLGFLWTNAEFSKQGNAVAGTAEIPMIRGDWASKRWKMQLEGWFGEVPQGLVTIDSVYWAQAGDAARLALLEHELYHLRIKINKKGEMMFDRKSGKPQLRIQGHDVEEFLPVVERYGAGNAGGKTAELVRIGANRPTIAEADIQFACGACR